MRFTGGVFRLDVDVRSGALVAHGVILAVIHLAADTVYAAPVFTADFLVHFDHLASSITDGKGITHVTFCHRRSASVLWDG